MISRWMTGLVTACLMNGHAMGGAWTLPEGQGQVITSASRTITPVRAWFGEVIDADSNTNQVFAEYGLWDDLTVGGSLFAKYATTSDDLETRIGIHARHQIWTGDAGDVFSVQAGVSAPMERWLGGGLGDNRPNSATEIDLRALYGRGWQWDLGNSFVSSELGLRFRGEGLDEQLRFDVTAGHEPIRGVLLLGSAFSSFPLGNKDEVSIKLAPSVAYTLWPLLGRNEKKPWQPISPDTLQIGVTWDAARQNSGLEIGVSIWKSF
ncbi:MAG: hypothetical protein AB8B85_12480 [Paracoccaceae bacterium]